MGDQIRIEEANSIAPGDFGEYPTAAELFVITGARGKMSAVFGRSACQIRPRPPGWRMSIEEAIARDFVAILFVTFLFGGGALWLIVATIAEQWRKYRVADRNAALKQTMITAGYRPEEIVRVLNAGSGEG
jgi:hypothetical protein